MKTCDCLIVGGGSAALACALSLYQQGIHDVIIVERDAFLGGVLNQCIHNGFGLQVFKAELTGPQYAQRYIDLLKRISITVYSQATVLSLDENKKAVILSKKEGYIELQAKAVVMASGCRERSRGSISIPGDRCCGIMSAGTAQHYLNLDGYLPGKNVFILGSGDIGLIMARRMTLEGAVVHGVAEIMPYSNGLKRNIVQCLNDFDIPLYLSTTVVKTIGKQRLEKIVLAKVDEHLKPIPGTEWEVEVDCLLLSIGLIPELRLLDDLPIKRDPSTKSVCVNESYETNLPGFFVCGNALHVHDLVDFVSREAEQCGHFVARYLTNQLHEGASIDCTALNNVAALVPQCIRLENIDQEVEFTFRVRKPMKNCELVILKNGEELKRIRKRVVLPAEMEMVRLTAHELEGLTSLGFEMRECI